MSETTWLLCGAIPTFIMAIIAIFNDIKINIVVLFVYTLFGPISWLLFLVIGLAAYRERKNK